MTVPVDVDLFAGILAERFRAIVPGGFAVQAGDGMLWYSTAARNAGVAGTHVRDNWGAYGHSDEDNLVGVAVQALSELQDYVSEATADPWPGTTSQPSAHGVIREGNLHLWYGDVVLAVDPVPLASVESTGPG